ncbi:helix-turn-helix domain-containing protein [Niveispirillum sp. SYP-B3756]|uniref:GlxA family transcriptional regulator n=1 Tax=Niveispirillum sp. SYP-B3756 TaxID=2662178 RepID=UPI001290A2D7|nr:helix-turn-helix domain-containing protein [Niveispirillum sp. SYP-B3756]MQP65607.1 helix-turn-helix domain-containing protein [Niveispirillum sp. SYP-B3756]
MMADQTSIPVLVVVPPRALLLDIAGPLEVLRRSGLTQGSRVAYAPRYAGPDERVISSVGLELAGIAPLPDRVAPGTVILVSGNASPLPGQDVTRDRAAEQAIVDWLRRTVGPDHLLVCICSGAVLAGQAGLLNGRDCTTHHGDCEKLQRLAPAARVLENRLYVEAGPVWTSAGVTAGIDLMLHLLARQAGPAVASAVARHLVVYLRRAGADPQLSPWLEGRNHLHPSIHRVQDAIAADPARDWTLSDLSLIAHASARHLSRLFNDHAGMGVPDYINRLRVALARQLLENSRLDMETVAERAGFASARQLRRAWGRLHGTPPSAARALPAGKENVVIPSVGQ